MVVFTDRNSYAADIIDVIANIVANKQIFQCDNMIYSDFCTVKDIVLREKDLTDAEYAALSIDIKAVLKDSGINLYVRSISAAEICETQYIHMPFKDYVARETSESSNYTYSVSVHSVEEAKICENLGASRIITGHVYPTDCKQGLPPRGLEYLKSIVNAVSIPVVAIGGILPDNLVKTVQTGIYDVAVMSYINKIV